MNLEPDKLNPGFKIGNYEIIDKIGEGGHATLYRAEQVNLQRNVALKVVSREFSRDSEFIEMFIREAHAMAKLDHPNIVKVYDAGTTPEGLSYLAMELVEGGDLQEMIYQKDLLPLDRVLDIAAKISDALSYGQNFMQLTHGDLKPANIMLDFDGVPKLADFGLAETIFHCAKRKSTKVYGTPLYVSPETISGKRRPCDIQADIYSFGCMLYHLIAGEPPFQAETLKELVLKHLKNTPPKLSQAVPGTPARLSSLVRSMMAKKPYERPESWAKINSDLRYIIQQRRHPWLHVIRQHWSYAFDYSEREMIILLFILSSVLLLVRPWIGSALLISLTAAHYTIHSRK
ncbi:MAG: serine/threonine protein kinase, partial [Victivallales bacterium]|nr:serine/threonine protein kinase [Victivallales bacterium]